MPAGAREGQRPHIVEKLYRKWLGKLRDHYGNAANWQKNDPLVAIDRLDSSSPPLWILGDEADALGFYPAAKAFMEKLTVKDVFIAGLSPYLFFWAFVGIGAAWKLASDYGTSVE